MKDTSAKFALMPLGTAGVQQGWDSTAYSSLRTLYLRGSVAGQRKVKVIGPRCGKRENLRRHLSPGIFLLQVGL